MIPEQILEIGSQRRLEANQEIALAKPALSEAAAKRFVTVSTDRDPTYERLTEDVAKTQADLAAQRATVEATKYSIRNIQDEMMVKLNQQDLQREVKADESNYLYYLAKREQERTSDALDVTRIANVAIAVPPAVPVLSVFSWPIIILFALGASTVLSIGASYAADYFDSPFHTPAQVIDILRIPLVATLSKKTG